jgi:ankyrin repeat protein
MATAIGMAALVNAHLTANPKDVDAKGANGVQLMVHANHPEIVALLIKHGADATLALQQLAWSGRVELLKVALDAGGKVNMPVEGRRPLHIAAAMGHMDAVKLFLAAGAEIHVRSKGADWERKNALALALMGQHAEVAAFLRAEMAKTPAPPPPRPKGPFGTGPRRFPRY